MEWGTPDGHGKVTTSEIPLAVKEVLANYDNIKAYAPANSFIGIGMGADQYVDNPDQQALATANYQLFTPGNAMKMDAIVQGSGTLKFETVDKLVVALQENNIPLYGHNFIWHTQQQTYLKSLIAPKLVVESSSDIQTILVGDAANFDGSTTGGWGSWGGNKKSAEVVEGAGEDGSAAMVLENNSDGNAWEAQFAYTFDAPLDNTKEYTVRFKAKSTSGAGELQFQYQNSVSYGSQGGYNTFNVGTDWVQCEYSFTPGYDDSDRIIFNFGKVGGTYQIDNIKFGIAKDQGEPAGVKIRRIVPRRAAAKTYYVLKTPEEKREALLGAMDMWIKGMADHLKETGVNLYGYDVINEPITDGDCKVRGVDGVFGGSWDEDDVTYYDEEPVENEDEGLNLNWGSGHFYWGYYVPDFAVQAFQKARAYLPAETKLFVNDYNLETNPKKLEALIQFAKDIDEANGSPIVDGIGTQMHVSIRPTDDAAKNAEVIADLKAKVDAQFKTMAATGKLVRVTELDVALGTSSPSSAQYQAQADAYRVIAESYYANVPAEQQSGITIWSLSDNEDEHEYWLKGEVPNLFDKDYLRKWAYKGFCDGLAGEDLGLKFGGEDYKAFYEKNNVSSSVK